MSEEGLTLDKRTIRSWLFDFLSKVESAGVVAAERRELWDGSVRLSVVFDPDSDLLAELNEKKGFR